MVRHWSLVERIETEEGPLELRRRDERDFMITIAGRVLMSSERTRSEVAVAELGCAPIRDRTRPRVLLGGLGLGYTLRATLDSLPKNAIVVQAELNPAVVEWCRGPLAVLTNDALSDPRVIVHVGDVTDLIRQAADEERPFDAIIVDLYEGPGHVPPGRPDPLFGARILEVTAHALSAGGVYAVWGEKKAPEFEARLKRLGFDVRLVQNHRGQRHPVYVAVRGEKILTPKPRAPQAPPGPGARSGRPFPARSGPGGRARPGRNSSASKPRKR